jgi:FlaA1/EpsC-like NDP-sugar epimerase
MILADKRVLITGGTGSLGKVLTRRILSGEVGVPAKIIIFSRDEAKQHHMRMAYLHRTVATDEVIYENFRQVLEFRIGDVRDYASVAAAVRDVDVVLNAAALKQVPTCEYFPYEAVLTNITGPQNIVRAIQENRLAVEKVIGISTDKAAKPVNAMGMTKALQERVFTAANVFSDHTSFGCVRYGNVLASRGSVIPLFHDQIANGGPVTITVPEMTRFLLSLDQAVDTVFAAVRSARPGETFVPRAPSATIENIAKALIEERAIDVKVIGIRPGEKMHEIMISEEECHHTVARGDYFAILPMLPELCSDRDEPNALAGEFSSANNVMDLDATHELLKQHKLLVGDASFEGDEELLR